VDEITIGVLLDPDIEYGIGVLEGVREYARHFPAWRVLPLGQAQEGLLVRLARTGELRGLIGTIISDRWFGGRLAALPTVNTSNLSHVTAVSSVVPDDEAAGRLVARHFCDLNVPAAGVVADRATYAARLRREGFLTEMRSRGVPVSEPPENDAFRPEAVWVPWFRSLAAGAAVFCASDAQARRLYLADRALAGAAGAAPLLAGVGDSLAERAVAGLDLTSVALPARAVGRRAAARLERLLAGERVVTREAVAPEALVVRASTARYGASDEVVARAMGLALRTLAQNLGVDELARRVGVSRRTLELRFRAVFGHGPAREVRARKLAMAARLLAETELPVAEVARRCGCGGAQAFTTLFRRAFGSAPGAYRRAKLTLTRPLPG